MELKLAGVVEADDYQGICEVGPSIGGKLVGEAIKETWGRYSYPVVRVYLGIEPESSEPVGAGRLVAYNGFGGTDVTPPELPEITIGTLDLVGRLDELNGRTVLLIIEDDA